MTMREEQVEERGGQRAPIGGGGAFGAWCWGALVAAVLAAALLVGTSANNAERPLQTHEMFVAQAAREMLAAGEWIVPSFNWRPRLVKPPLMYWLVMAASEATGREVSPLLARLPSALSGVALAGLAVWLGAVVYGRRTGVIAGALTAGTMGFYLYANTARPEMLYAACGGLMSVGLAGAWLSEDRSRRQFGWAMLAWAGAGLATLAKGVHLPLLMMLGVVVCAAAARWGGRGSGAARGGGLERLRHALRPAIGVGVLLVIALPWVVAVAMRRPEAIDVWIEQIFAGPGEEEDWALLKWLTPYYFAAFPWLIMPWAILLPMGLAVSFQRGRPELARGRVLFWMVVVVFAVMSLQYHRRDYYLLPIVPATAVLMARGTEDLLAALLRRQARVVAWLSGGGAALFGVICAVLAVAKPSEAVDPLFGLAAAFVAAVASVALGAAAVRLGLRGERGAGGLLLAAAFVPALSLGLLGGHDELWKDRRYREWGFVRDVARTVGPDGRLFVYRCDEAELVYALNRPVRELPDPAGAPDWSAAPDEQSGEGGDGQGAEWWLVLPRSEWERTAAEWPPHELVRDVVDAREDDAPRVLLRFGGASRVSRPAG